MNINNAFSFPTADGSPNQILQTNGSGTLSWVNSADTDDQNLSLTGNTLNITDGTGVDLSAITPISIQDSGGDTKIQTEETLNEDIIRMDVGGTEALIVTKNSNDQPMMYQPSSNENITLGNFAGFSLNTGASNVIIGRDAGKFGQGMSSCVLIGEDAGENNISGTSNTFIGYHAGDNTNSNNNTFVGANCGDATTSGA